MKEARFIPWIFWISRHGTGTTITCISNSMSAYIPKEVTPGDHRKRGPGYVSGISWSVLCKTFFFFTTNLFLLHVLPPLCM